MTDQDNLRERLTQIVDVALYMWTNDPETTGTDGEFVAQAIIDELGLTVEQRDTGLQSNPPGRRIYVSRVVGDWDN